MMRRAFIAIVLACLVLASGTSFAQQKSIRVENPRLLQHGHMKFNNDDEGFTGTITVVTGGTYYGFINGVVGHETEGVSFVDDDVDGDYLLVANSFEGHYLALFSLNASTSAGSEVVHCAVFVNDTKSTIQYERKMSAGGDVGDAGQPGYLFLDSGDKVRVKCTTDNDSKTIEVKHESLVILRLGN